MKIINLLLLMPAAVATLGLRNEVREQETSPKAEDYCFKIDDREITLSLDKIKQMVLCEYNMESDIDFEVKKSDVIKDYTGNEYLLTSFNPSGYSIVSLSNLETLEVNYSSEIDFTQYDFSSLKYVPLLGIWNESNGGYSNILNEESMSEKSFTYLGNHYDFSMVNDLTLLKLNFDKKLSYISNSGGTGSSHPAFAHPILEGEITATYEVDYSWFFKYNDSQFAYSHYSETDSNGNTTRKGLCEYVALGLIIEYYDFFKCAGYFSESEVSNYLNTGVPGSDYKHSIPSVDNSFVSDLFIRNGSRINLSLSRFNSLFNLFMTGKSISCSYERSPLGLWSLKNKIRNDRIPIMISGLYPRDDHNADFHNIIVYGVFDDGNSAYNGKLLTHYGWKDGYSQCIISNTTTTALYYWRLVHDDSASHIHRNVFNINGSLRCGRELPM